MGSSRKRLHLPGYQVMEFLGSGARSTIWQVRDRRGNKVFAVKRVIRRPEDDDRFLRQALNEFEVASQLDHPGLRKCYRVRRVRKWFQLCELHIFMEMCEGLSCQADRPSDLARIADIFVQVSQALAHMHAQGFIHADLKPNNIIVSPAGTAKIIDFGQSCRIGTIKERIQGTPDFIAPEQVRRRPLDVRTDVFNLGATLYWTLTGRPIPTILPKKADSIQLLSDMRVTPVEELNPEVPPALSRLLSDCIEPDPSRRPGSIRDVGGRLDLIAHTLNRDGEATNNGSGDGH